MLACEGKAAVPHFFLADLLSGLERINAELVAAANEQNPADQATLDMDATLIETQKNVALLCYKGFKTYQPLNTYWAEKWLILHTEFKDGDVPAGHEQVRIFIRALLASCDRGDKGFGRIEFALGADVTPEFKKAVREAEERHPFFDKKGHVRGEWAEVCFVPNKSATKIRRALPLHSNPGTAEAVSSPLDGLSSLPDHLL
jgi:hypothetical protein